MNHYLLDWAWQIECNTNDVKGNPVNEKDAPCAQLMSGNYPNLYSCHGNKLGILTKMDRKNRQKIEGGSKHSNCALHARRLIFSCAVMSKLTTCMVKIGVLYKLSFLRGYCTPGQFLDCFCIFLKNCNTLVTSKICFL